jgi:hypothetical protein
VGLTTSQPSVSQLSRKCGSLDVSQPFGPSWPLTGIALPLPSLCSGKHYARKINGSGGVAPHILDLDWTLGDPRVGIDGVEKRNIYRP